MGIWKMKNSLVPFIVLQPYVVDAERKRKRRSDVMTVIILSVCMLGIMFGVMCKAFSTN